MSLSDDFEEIGFSDTESDVVVLVATAEDAKAAPNHKKKKDPPYDTTTEDDTTQHDGATPGADDDGEASCSKKKSQLETGNPVILQLPPELLFSRQHEAPPPSPASLHQPSEKRLRTTGYDDQTSSFASSYIHGFDNNMNPRNNFDESSSSWSHISAGSKFCDNNDEDYASVAGSVISGFDLLSIDGNTLRRCHRCTSHNREDACICNCCGAALVANPCLDIDLQIAMSLQRKEEEDAFLALRESEHQRSFVVQQPIEQAEWFAKEVVSRISQIVADDHDDITVGCGIIKGLCENDLSRLTFRFLSKLISANNDIPSMRRRRTVELKYLFSSETTGGLDHVQLHGFTTRTPLRVAKDMAVAYRAASARGRGSAKDRTGKVRYSHGAGSFYTIGRRRDHHRLLSLGSIPEKENHNFQSDQHFSNTGSYFLGWIVLTFGMPAKEMKGAFEVHDDPEDVLPLVFFDASRRADWIIERLMNALTQTVSDFLLLLKQPEEEIPTSVGASRLQTSISATDQQQDDPQSVVNA